MAWTAPRTWVTGEVVTAALLNTHLRDNLLYLGEKAAKQTYSPAWTAVTTDPTNYLATGAYTLIGGQVTWSAYLTGDASYTNGQGYYRFSLPVAGDQNGSPGSGHIMDSGTAYYPVSCIWVSSTTVGLIVDTASTQVSDVGPFTFVQADTITLGGAYIAA